MGRTSRSSSLLVSAALSFACMFAACTQPPVKGPAQANRMYVIDLNGQVTLTKNGQLRLALASGNCTSYFDVPHPYGGVQTTSESCAPFDNDDWRTLHVRTPWGKEILAARGAGYWAEFDVDWSESGIDPLGKDAAAQAAQPWKFDSPHAADPVEWTPDEDTQQALLGFVGQASGVETTVADVSAPARLEVTELRFTGEVREGKGVDLVVTLKNTGDGDAYRVYATTLSLMPALHSKRLGFGRIAAGTAKTRRLHADIPRGYHKSDVVVVLEFSEAHDFTPAQVNLRAPVLPAADVAKLTLVCSVGGVRAARVSVDAGQTVKLVCDVAAVDTSARAIQVEAQLAASTMKAGAPFDLVAGGSKNVSIPLVIPGNASMDSEWPVTVTARDTIGAVATASFTLVVRRQSICPGGKLSREAAARKIADLKQALDEGTITQAEYQQYESATIGCMKAD